MMIDYSKLVIEGNVDHDMALEWEAHVHFTVNDALDLVNEVGLKAFLDMLYEKKTGRVLTAEEIEAMQVLHDNWEL